MKNVFPRLCYQACKGKIENMGKFEGWSSQEITSLKN